MTVYLVGAGPGDPGLLTVRGAEVLARADVVVHDRLSDIALLDLAPPGAANASVGHQHVAESCAPQVGAAHSRAGQKRVADRRF